MADSLSRILWNENAGLVKACAEHPLIQGLVEGVVAEDTQRQLAGQEALWLHARFRAYALASARCHNLRHAQRFHELMGDTLDQLKAQRERAARRGVDLIDIKPLPTSRAYIDFLLRTAWTNAPGETAAAVAPTIFLDLHIARGATVKSASEDTLATHWLRDRSGPQAERRQELLESLLDALGDDSPKIRDAFRYSLQCRRLFFSAVQEGS